jgi:hypothetical protein
VVSKDGLDEKRRTFATAVSCIDSSDVISIDESSIAYETPPRKGYAPKGKRLNCSTRSFHPKKWSIILAISKGVVIDSLLVDGSVNSDIFSSFVTTLDATGKKYLLMDNASFHKTKAVREACNDAKLEPLYLPPYTPWFQPVEHCFSIVKRRMAGMPRLDVPNAAKMEAVKSRIQTCLAIEPDTLTALFDKCWTRMSQAMISQT